VVWVSPERKSFINEVAHHPFARVILSARVPLFILLPFFKEL
jgi:hypothetical protein